MTFVFINKSVLSFRYFIYSMANVFHSFFWVFTNTAARSLCARIELLLAPSISV